MLAAVGALAAVSSGRDSARELLPTRADVPVAGSCSCDAIDSDEKVVFYNRVPKTGSTTMLTFLDAAAKTNGYKVIHSEDFDPDHFDPSDREVRKGVVQDMSSVYGAIEGKVVFERHIHYIDFAEFGRKQPIYMNMLRDPGSLRTSGFYFFRDCVCSGAAEPTNVWCSAHWDKKSDEFCATTINTCYADFDVCKATGHHVFGQPLNEFLCGTSDECQDFDSDRKTELAKHNLANKYSWVGILESLTNSLQLLQQIMPSFYGSMNMTEWGQVDVNPVGKDDHDKAYEKPTELTMQRMRNASQLAREYELYDYARELFECKLRACGIPTTTQRKALDVALEVWAK